MGKLFVLSLGGSLINPGEVDTVFLKKFKILIETETKKGNRFILVCGGGKPARSYQNALKAVSTPGNNELDWMGIYATHFNAQLVRLMLGKLANKDVAEDPNVKVNFKEKVFIAGGWIPGRSTDDIAVRLAKIYGATTIINLSNIDYVYTKDPRKFKTAEKIEAITWKDYRGMVGSTWNPGANVPFDSTASQTAEKNNIAVVIANGKNLKNLQNILQGKKFLGTTIK